MSELSEIKMSDIRRWALTNPIQLHLGKSDKRVVEKNVR